MVIRKIGHIFLLIFVFGTLFIIRKDLAYSLGLLKRFATSYGVVVGDGAFVRVVEKETVFSPGALKITSQKQSPSVNTKKATDAVFTTLSSEIFAQTNIERTQAGLPLLERDSALDSMAKMKVADMIEKNYFDHVSPTGESIKELAKKSDYEYAIIGENLALGDTLTAGEIVDAWMASPGHKANILHTGYTALGVAVGRGVIDGVEHIIAIQHFATPISKCPQVNTFLKTTIANKQREVDQLKKEITVIEFQIKNSTQTGESELRTKYNTLVASYNTLMANLKKNVDEYNLQVNKFNSCVQKL